MSPDFEPAFIRRLLEFPYLQSPLSVVDVALNMVKIKPGEVFSDLGCGDGTVLLRAAEKFNTYCVGFEINPKLAMLARWKAKNCGLGHLVDVVCADIFTLDLSRLNVIYVYPFPTIIGRLSEKIAAECRKGTRILVHDYPLEGLNPAKSVKIPEKNLHTHLIHLYIKK
ncbi:MAG: class I SAM-dependent methyltransferase [Nitrososphaerota archaeon]|nr:class I SAM-dependent methyltransferase [Candidatus Bathyarchaeota archaeon]MDW8023850.1 class I SAM-dependent methyltransferase [Nitrososphaerota archaeon]